MTRTRDVAAKCLQALSMVVVLAVLGHSDAWAATEWNTKEYDLYPGDFNGDG